MSGRATQFGPSFGGVIGAAREDITPPAGIYARCWAAAKHDVMSGVHRPMTLTCVTFRGESGGEPLVLMGLDLMTWRSKEDEWFVRGFVLEQLGLAPERLMMCLSHTHASPAVQRVNAGKPGGELIEGYLRQLREAAVRAGRRALESGRPGVLTWRYGRCDLATNRDFVEPETGRVVCGFNPDAAADETVLVGRVTDEAGGVMATIVNYACHPTTLAWENTQISPDYVGAMREVVEGAVGGLCLYLQGASGELAPAEQYVGDVAVADRNGRRLGFAVLGVIEAMGPGGTRLEYEGVVESGAPLGVWRRRGAKGSGELSARVVWAEMPLKEQERVEKLAATDPVITERVARRRAIRQIVGDGPTSRMPVWIWHVGDSVLVGQQNEAYSDLQVRVRGEHPGRALAVMNLVNGSGGYLPPAGVYKTGCYQVSHTPFDAGSLERLIEVVRI